MNMGIEPFLVATSVNLIQAQRLIRRVCKDCKKDHPTPIEALIEIGFSAEEAGKMKTFPAGSFAYLDPDMHHYAMASGATTVQVHGMSPLQFNYVNPADDPSKK